MAAGVKPIAGADLWLQNEHDVNNPSRIVLLCKNNQGYLNLTELISQSYLEGQHRGIDRGEEPSGEEVFCKSASSSDSHVYPHKSHASSRFFVYFRIHGDEFQEGVRIPCNYYFWQ